MHKMGLPRQIMILAVAGASTAVVRSPCARADALNTIDNVSSKLLVAILEGMN
jgi:hypothetical protein